MYIIVTALPDQVEMLCVSTKTVFDAFNYIPMPPARHMVQKSLVIRVFLFLTDFFPFGFVMTSKYYKTVT